MKNNLKQYAMVLMLGTGMASTATTAHAADDVSLFADIGVYSQYIWRGMNQSVNNDASVQGDVGIEHSSGLSANVWFATGVDVGAGAETEYDITVDYSGEVGDIGYSVGYIMFKYMEDSTLDFEETYVGVSYSIASLTAYIGDGYNYYALDAGDTIAELFDAGVTVGYTDPDVGTSEVTDITISASKDFDMGSYTLSPSITYAMPQGELDTAGYTNEVAVGVNASF